jgi:hypothetical protein
LKNQDLIPQGGVNIQRATEESQEWKASAKRQFIEPEISPPVDVLEATTFFQAIDSGATG